MAGHLTTLTGGPVAEFKRTLEHELRTAADSLAGNFGEYFDANLRDLVRAGLSQVGADEGTIWLIDESRESLIPAFNSGPQADAFVGHFKQSLRSGMISMVVATEQPICENEVHRDQRQDRTLDSKLGVQTQAMIASPFYFAGELRGVISAVKLDRSAGETSGSSAGFTWDELQRLQSSGLLIARLMEHKLLTRLLGLEMSA